MCLNSKGLELRDPDKPRPGEEEVVGYKLMWPGAEKASWHPAAISNEGPCYEGQWYEANNPDDTFRSPESIVLGNTSEGYIWNECHQSNHTGRWVYEEGYRAGFHAWMLCPSPHEFSMNSFDGIRCNQFVKVLLRRIVAVGWDTRGRDQENVRCYVGRRMKILGPIYKYEPDPTVVCSEREAKNRRVGE